MYFFNQGMLKIVAFVLVTVCAAFLMMRMSPFIFPPVPDPSSTFDCDDSALAMYNHFKSLGIEARPIIGNLAMDGEEYMESDHVWLLVTSGDKEIAYDWGFPRFDKQHYEGFEITLDKLRVAVADDFAGGEYLASVK